MHSAFSSLTLDAVGGNTLDDVLLEQDEHDETVVLLSKGEIDSKKMRVEFSLEDMDMSGFQKGATYGQIKERVLQQTGMKVSSLYIAQVKQKCGIIERECYNKPKSKPIWRAVPSQRKNGGKQECIHCGKN